MIDDDDDDAVPKAIRQIQARRVVYISCAKEGAGWKLAVKPLHARFRSNTDANAFEVTWYGDDMWVANDVKLAQWLDGVTDFILLADDETYQVLQRARPDLEVLKPDPGVELIHILRRNEARAKQDELTTRIWMAKVQDVRMEGVARIAGRPDWNLKQTDQDNRLHWLYDRDEVVGLKRGAQTGAVDRRLTERIDRFVEHEQPKCRWCAGAHLAADHPRTG